MTLQITNLFALKFNDKREINYSDFDEYTISHSCIHRNEKVYFFHDRFKVKSCHTWESTTVIPNEQSYVAGPMKFQFSNQIAYIQHNCGSAQHDGQQKQAGLTGLLAGLGNKKKLSGQDTGTSLSVMAMAD